MSGPNQHYIPQFLQQGFAVRKPKGGWIWKYGRNEEPIRDKTKNIASERFFYGEPQKDSLGLDDFITKKEDKLSKALYYLKRQGAGVEVDANIAAELVSTLSTRNAHFRQGGAEALGRLIVELESIVRGDEGINFFQEKNNAIDQGDGEQSFTGDGCSVLQKDLSENLKNFAKIKAVAQKPGGNFLLSSIFSKIRSELNVVVAQGQLRGLGQLHIDNPRAEFLMSMRWKVVKCASGLFVLPDCVALSIDREGAVFPYALCDHDIVQEIALPISSTLALVGAFGESRYLDVNKLAMYCAEVSYDYFLAAEDSAELRSYQGHIGNRALVYIDEAIEGALRPYRS